jgi:hypothetical protein
MIIWVNGSAPPEVHGFKLVGRCEIAMVTVAFVENAIGAVVVVTGLDVVVVEPPSALWAVAPQAVVTTASSPRIPSLRWALLSSTEGRR